MPEVHEYEDDTIPQHVAAHYRRLAHDRALRLLEVAYQQSERRCLDDDAAREREPGQVYTGINLFA